MRRIFRILAAVLLLSAFNHQLATAFAQGTAFTYQGKLNNNGAPANGSYDISFTIYTTNVTGTAIAGPVTNAAVAVTDGLFTTLVDFGNAFTGGSNWLAIAVSTNGANSFFPLTPRQQLTPVPYAMTAENVFGISIQNNSDGAPNVIGGSSINFVSAGVEGATIAGGGTVDYLGSPYTNSVTGNFGTVSGGFGNTASGNFATVVGGRNNTASGIASTAMGDTTTASSIDSTAMGENTVASGAGSMAAGNYAVAAHTGAFVWEDATSTTPFSSSGPNQFLIKATGGVGINTNNPGTSALLVNGNITATSFTGSGSGLTGLQGANVSGVALLGSGNAFTGNQTIVGTIVGGYSGNQLTGSGVTGGFIGGGGQLLFGSINYANIVSGAYAAILGGAGNTASGSYSTAMGDGTTASGPYSTAMGEVTIAGGNYSTAMGYYADAANNGTFVWADSTSTTPFTSTAANQFLIRATGGVGIGTASPTTALQVNGTVTASAFAGAGTGLTGVALLGSGNTFTTDQTVLGQVIAGGSVGAVTLLDRFHPVNGFGWQLRADTTGLNASRFNGGAGSQYFTISTNGNVGIGTTTPNSDSLLQVKGMVRMGSETGTSEAPNKSILVRRINSTSDATGQVVARCLSESGNVMTLERDGSNGGLVLKLTGSNFNSGGIQVSGYGITAGGAFVGVNIIGLANNSTTQIFTDAQRICNCRLSFGEPLNDTDLTTVEMMRVVDTSANNDYYWTGTVMSTVNQ